MSQRGGKEIKEINDYYIVLLKPDFLNEENPLSVYVCWYLVEVCDFSCSWGILELMDFS